MNAKTHTLLLISFLLGVLLGMALLAAPAHARNLCGPPPPPRPWCDGGPVCLCGPDGCVWLQTGCR